MQDLDDAIENDVEDYFLGTIVLVQEGDEMPSIADGQQRLATSTIVLARVRDQLNEIKRQGSARSIDDQFLRKIDRGTEDTVPRLRLNVEDNEFFSTFILQSQEDGSYSDPDLDRAAIHASNRRLLEASRYIDQFLRDKTKNMRADAQATTRIFLVICMAQTACRGPDARP